MAILHFNFGCFVCAVATGCACKGSSRDGQLKDESAACYHCYEKCQTASSSTDSPTVPDIWRRVREREREGGGGGTVMKVHCVTFIWKNEWETWRQ